MGTAGMLPGVPVATAICRLFRDGVIQAPEAARVKVEGI